MSGPQERVQRRIVQQTIDVVPLPMLDAPVSQMVGQLAEVLAFFNATLPVLEQVIEVPQITVDQAPQRSSLGDPQLVEQLVGVPVPRNVILERGTDIAGNTWCQVTEPPRYEVEGLLVDEGHTSRPVGSSCGIHRQPRAVYKYWARLRRCAGLWLCTSLCSTATSSCSPRRSTGWCLRSSSSPECWAFRCEQRRVRTLPNCAEDRRFVRCSSWWKLTCPFACNDRLVQTVQKPCWCRRCSSSTRGRAAVNMQPKFQQVSA